MNRKLDMDDIQFELSGIVAVLGILMESFSSEVVTAKKIVERPGDCAQSIFVLRAYDWYEPALNRAYMDLLYLLERVNEVVT